MATYTVGSGGNFATFRDAFASFSAGLAASHELVMISDVTETAQPNLAFRWNGFTITIRSSVNHYGVWSAAYKINANFAAGGISGLFDAFGLNPASPEDTLRLTIDGVGFYAQHAGFTNSSFIYHPTGGTVTRYLAISNCMFDMNGRTGLKAIGTGVGAGSVIQFQAWNCLAFNGAVSTYAFVNVGIPGYYESCTYWGANGLGFLVDGPAARAYNCASLGVEAGQFSWSFGIGGDPTSLNNASSDATADDAATQSGNLINQSAAANFLSTDINSADFLKLREDSPLRQAGRAPTIAGNTLGIRGNARPGFDSLISIGADEWGPYITRSSLFPASTAKPSHARILREHRSPAQAQAFHEAMRGAS